MAFLDEDDSEELQSKIVELQRNEEEGRKIKSKVHPNEKYGRQVLEILQSLNVAIEQASGKTWTTRTLREMSVEEMLLELASNKIRFVYIGKENATC